MRILVFSDSHSGYTFMRRCTKIVQPDVLIHLGDFYDDGQVIREEYPSARFFQVAGNCDWNLAPPSAREILTPKIDGIRFYLTHGHRHGVKQSTESLEAAARASGAAAVLYGHTHREDLRQLPDGLWVMNPGACGYFGGSAGLIETEPGRILSCRLLHEDDLQAMLRG